MVDRQVHQVGVYVCVMYGWYRCVCVCGAVFVWRHLHILSFLSLTIFFSKHGEKKFSGGKKKLFFELFWKKKEVFKNGGCLHNTKKRIKLNFGTYTGSIFWFLISGLYCILLHRIPIFLNRGSVTSIGPRMGLRRMVLYRSSMSTHSPGLTIQLGYSHWKMSNLKRLVEFTSRNSLLLWIFSTCIMIWNSVIHLWI